MKQDFVKKDTLVVKGMAILCLLFYHLFENARRVTDLQVDYRPFSLDSFLLFSSFGNICVAIFAFLSAYGITKGIMMKEKAGDTVGYGALYQGAIVRYLKLTLNFVIMFLSINLLWFSKFNYASLYGNGWQGGLYGLLDATGLASIFNTPTLNDTWWYMELAILIVFVAPLLYLVVKKLRYYTIFLAVLLPVMVELSFDVKRYYFVILFGVLAAALEWFEKLFAWKAPVWLQAVVGVILLAGSVLFRQNYVVYTEFAYLVDAPIALLFAWFGARVLAEIPGIQQVLAFLGKHSMNMYFVHTFFYMILFQPFVYSFRYAGVIYAVLIAVSLAYSVVLELVKKLCQVPRLVTWIEKRLNF